MKTSRIIRAELDNRLLAKTKRVVTRSYTLLEELHSIYSYGYVYDDDIASPQTINELVMLGLVIRKDGWNFLSKDGSEIVKRTLRYYKIWRACRRLKWKIQEWWRK